MTSEAERGETTLAPDEAFAVLGNETRMEILQALAGADGPLPFSALRERAGVRDSGQFNYHLDKLVGHFLDDTDEGYELRQAGRRVIEAVLSGAITDAPVIERTAVDQPCHYCGAPSIEVSYRQEQVGTYCTECGGTYRGSNDADESTVPAERDRLGYLPLPPAGIQGRTPEAILRAATTRFFGEILTASGGVCPRCTARTTHTANVCEEHDSTDAVCDRCERRYAVAVTLRCTNCPYGVGTVLGAYLLASPELRAFLLEHGLDPVSPDFGRLWDVTAVYEEEVIGTEPFSARLVFSADDTTLSITVDEELSVVDTTETTTG